MSEGDLKLLISKLKQGDYDGVDINDIPSMLKEALIIVDSMTAEDFETECNKAGYKPVREYTSKMTKRSLTKGEIDCDK